MCTARGGAARRPGRALPTPPAAAPRRLPRRRPGNRDPGSGLGHETSGFVSLGEREDGTAGAEVLEQLPGELPHDARSRDHDQRVGAALQGKRLRPGEMADMANQPVEGERFEELPLVAVEAAGDHELQLLGDAGRIAAQTTQRLEQRRRVAIGPASELAGVDERLAPVVQGGNLRVLHLGRQLGIPAVRDICGVDPRRSWRSSATGSWTHAVLSALSTTRRSNARSSRCCRAVGNAGSTEERSSRREEVRDPGGRWLRTRSGTRWADSNGDVVTMQSNGL